MSYIPKILAFAGSLRQDSFNKKMIQIAAQGARKAGAEVIYVDLRDFPVPLYDGDLEAASGLPEAAIRLQDLMLMHHGFLIASPEYNSGITGVLKNYIDWTSRPRGELKNIACYRNKVAAIMSASPGALGGIRALGQLRSILQAIGVLTLPEDFALGKAHEAFDEQGQAKDAAIQKRIEGLGENLTKILLKLEKNQ